MTTGTRTQALIIARPNRGPIPGDIKHSLGPIKLIQSSDWSLADTTRPGFENVRNTITTEMKNLVEANGHIVIGRPTVVRIETRNDEPKIARERGH